MARAMRVLDFQHLRHRLAWTFPDDPVLGPSDASTSSLPFPSIVGVARSGTTLLGCMLDAHPDLAIPPATGFLGAIVERPVSAGPLTALELHRFVTQGPSWSDFKLDADAYLAALTALHHNSVSDGLLAFYRLYAQQLGKPRATGRYLEVRYEDLVHAPEQSLREVCRFVNLPFDSGMPWCQAAFQEASRHASDADRWCREMTGEERTEFESVAGDLLAELGYW
jgi:hypothetical protein